MLLLLEGGAEFSGAMSALDLRAIDLAGGMQVPICILPTAAAPDHNHRRAAQNGIRWFKSLGAQNVSSVDVLDSASANDPTLAASIRTSRLVYLLGGFPRHLGMSLAGSLCWQAALDALNNGALIAGSSAGAMVLCEHFYDPQSHNIVHGLNLIANACVLPHHNNFGKSWAASIRRQLPNAVLLGIDESTGIIFERDQRWHVYGAGAATVYAADSNRSYSSGEAFSV